MHSSDNTRAALSLGCSALCGIAACCPHVTGYVGISPPVFSLFLVQPPLHPWVLESSFVRSRMLTGLWGLSPAWDGGLLGIYSGTHTHERVFYTPSVSHALSMLRVLQVWPRATQSMQSVCDWTSGSSGGLCAFVGGFVCRVRPLLHTCAPFL